ncbi:DUF1836 domain-containing protein [Fusibacter tunisiensis]|uniref:DNA-binding transcriptional MerR regulator n=1 Tax=Fusibacter tunisiensis TaxID=1008308 RepID=A0ABS2MPB8_9FIRM|nr:DUF1836 domain-containing protein [Fusibacter tunisiensis]MBM7561249.1 DNA-binding transcriptional MerR regulator [Fusibacter tunisiensis]
MQKNQIKKILEFVDPNYEMIPNIPLYMDQLLDYLKSSLDPLARSESDSIFTKTMVNNYVKASVIAPPEKKKYSKDAIADLLLVYHLKQVFSIQDTKKIIDLARSENQIYYTLFTEIQAQTHEKIKSEILTEGSKQAQIEQLFKLSVEASSKKILAERLLDQLIETQESKE